MGYLLKMAWRNLGRQRGRTWLSLIAVASGVVVVILTMGYVKQMAGDFIGHSVNLMSGHVRVIHPEYKAKEQMLSLGYLVGTEDQPVEEMAAGMAELPRVTNATPRIRFGMLLNGADDRQLPVLGIGGNLETEEEVIKFSKDFAEGADNRIPANGTQEIMLGKVALDKLGLSHGDRVTAIFSTSLGSFRVASFTVSAVLDSGLKYLDEGAAFIPLDTAQMLLDMPGSATEIVLFGKGLGSAGAIVPGVKEYLAGAGGAAADLTAMHWQDTSELMSYLVKMQVMYYFIYAFIIGMASFVVFNTLLMVVSERTREIGMLSALGLKRGDIRRMFLLEGGVVAVLGSLLGVVVGAAVNLLTSRFPIDYSKAMEGMSKDILIKAEIRSAFTWDGLAIAFVLGVVVTLVAAWLPAKRAASLKPTEALRSL